MYVFRDPDPVLAAGPAPVTQLQIGQLASGGVRDEGGDPHPVDVVEAPQTRSHSRGAMTWSFYGGNSGGNQREEQ